MVSYRAALIPLVACSLSSASGEPWSHARRASTNVASSPHHHNPPPAAFVPLRFGTSRRRVPSCTSVVVIRSTAAEDTSSPTSPSSLERNDSDAKPAVRPDLPDYGKTSVDVDKHRLEDRAKKEKSDIVSRWRRKDLDGQTLIPQTLADMESDSDFQDTSRRLSEIGRDGMTKEERTNRRRALNSLGVPPFGRFVADNTDGRMGPTLRRRQCEVLQLNIGLYCNQACGHCHVESSPLRTQEMMSAETAARCLELLRDAPSVKTLDITGGAPELNSSFRYLVGAARSLRPPPRKGGENENENENGDELDIIDRCNLTVLQEPGQEDLVNFLAEHRVHVIASLPCYSAANVDKQRGSGVFDRSIAALLALNEVGYGAPGTGLRLDLVYNPLGAFLPPEQSKLEAKYREELEASFGVRFDSLYTITNMPIKRFADFLHRRGELAEYMDLLVRNFNPETTEKLMCLDTLSIGWDGGVYDCDFNQQLGFGLRRKTVFDVENLSDLLDVPIRTDNHCFGCTAGMGSS